MPDEEINTWWDRRFAEMSGVSFLAEQGLNNTRISKRTGITRQRVNTLRRSYEKRMRTAPFDVCPHKAPLTWWYLKKLLES